MKKEPSSMEIPVKKEPSSMQMEKNVKKELGSSEANRGGAMPFPPPPPPPPPPSKVMMMGKNVKKELSSSQVNRGGAMPFPPPPMPTPPPPPPTPSSSSTKAMMMEDELKASKRECSELMEQVLRLKEDKRVITDREMRGEERYRRFAEDVKKEEEVHRERLVELQCRIGDLERGKRSAEALVELYKCRFEELGTRVSRMEEDCKVLLSEQHCASNPVEEDEGVKAANGGGRPNETVDRNGVTEGPHSSQIASSTVSKEIDDPSNSGSHIIKKRTFEAVSPNNGMVSPMRTSGNQSDDIVEISDSDDEPIGVHSSASAVKRNRASPPGGGGGDDGSGGYGNQSGKQEMKQAQELMLEKKDLHGDHSSTVPRTASWEIESDMLLSLEKDPKLCMRAICALYREKCFQEKSVKELPYTQNNEKSDALRGIMLAEYLIDGDVEGKMKKSLLDLQKEVPGGLDDCKRLATQYSMKLFEIYKKWGDPLFQPIFSKLH